MYFGHMATSASVKLIFSDNQSMRLAITCISMVWSVGKCGGFIKTCNAYTHNLSLDLNLDFFVIIVDVLAK